MEIQLYTLYQYLTISFQSKSVTLITITSVSSSNFLIKMGLWDFAWWVHQEVNFSPRTSGHCLPTLRTDCTDFFSREFALFAVDFSSTMRNPKEP